MVIMGGTMVTSYRVTVITREILKHNSARGTSQFTPYVGVVRNGGRGRKERETLMVGTGATDV